MEKLCPLLLASPEFSMKSDMRCKGQECQWFDDNDNRCSIHSIKDNLKILVSVVEIIRREGK